MRILVWLVMMLLVGCREEQPNMPPGGEGSLELQVCSFNIRYEANGDLAWRAWPNRIDRVLATIRDIDPDVMGVQEALRGQAADLRASLPDYDFAGVGRDDGRSGGEYAGIFWKKARFYLVDTGTFWLSDRPDEPGSRSWGNEVVRCATWVTLVDRSSGRSFHVYNTHWDHRHQGSRERSAVLLAERIDARVGPTEPLILLGDFNATEENPAFAYLRGDAVTLAGLPRTAWSRKLRDPFDELFPDQRDRRTVHGWSGEQAGWVKIDHILVSAEAEPLDAGIWRAKTRKKQPSDHFPVWAKVSWPASTDAGNPPMLPSR